MLALTSGEDKAPLTMEMATALSSMALDLLGEEPAREARKSNRVQGLVVARSQGLMDEVTYVIEGILDSLLDSAKASLLDLDMDMIDRRKGILVL